MSRWGGQVFVTTLGFGDFLDRISISILGILSEKDWQLCWWDGWSDDPNT